MRTAYQVFNRQNVQRCSRTLASIFPSFHNHWWWFSSATAAVTERKTCVADFREVNQSINIRLLRHDKMQAHLCVINLINTELADALKHVKITQTRSGILKIWASNVVASTCWATQQSDSMHNWPCHDRWLQNIHQCQTAWRHGANVSHQSTHRPQVDST